MEKANVIKALECCATGGNCKECWYNGVEECDQRLCKDAVALLKASEAPKANTYSVAYVFTKKANMLSYITWKTMANIQNQAHADSMHKYYATEREVELLAMFRWEHGKCFCKIKCPINPMPVKGEFETPGTTTPVMDFLRANGWECQRKIYPRMFE